jgi:hypothetical protein
MSGAMPASAMASRLDIQPDLACPSASHVAYWHFFVHAPPFPAAFFPQASYAAASFFGLAAVGAVADSTHPAPPEVHEWIVSRVD